MKKIFATALILALTVSLAACGRSRNENTTPSTTQPSTGMDVIPDMNPMETNIPDPNVDTSMPMYTDGTDGTDGTEITIPGGPTISTEQK